MPFLFAEISFSPICFQYWSQKWSLLGQYVPTKGERLYFLGYIIPKQIFLFRKALRPFIPYLMDSFFHPGPAYSSFESAHQDQNHSWPSILFKTTESLVIMKLCKYKILTSFLTLCSAACIRSSISSSSSLS